jgi:DNA-binding winged helix-turn-helix (wHTH) protein
VTENTEKYEFKGFVLDTSRRELKYRGAPVEIEPRAFDLLVYLVHNRNRAVDKSELQDAVWPGKHQQVPKSGRKNGPGTRWYWPWLLLPL